MISAGEIVQWASTLGVVTLIGSLITIWSQRRKINTDSASVLTSSALSLLEPMRGELEELQKDNKEIKEELKKAQEQMTEFRIQMRKLLNEMSQYRELTTGESQIVSGY